MRNPEKDKPVESIIAIGFTAVFCTKILNIRLLSLKLPLIKHIKTAKIVENITCHTQRSKLLSCKWTSDIFINMKTIPKRHTQIASEYGTIYHEINVRTMVHLSLPQQDYI